MTSLGNTNPPTYHVWGLLLVPPSCLSYSCLQIIAPCHLNLVGKWRFVIFCEQCFLFRLGPLLNFGEIFTQTKIICCACSNFLGSCTCVHYYKMQML